MSHPAFLLVFLAVCAPSFGAGLAFTLDASSGSGSASSRAPSANPPCLQPSCVLFSGTLRDSDTDLSFIRLESISVELSSGFLSLDHTFFSLVPGLLSGDPDYATTGNPANVYSGPLFGIDIPPLTPAGVYTATVTIQASGGTGDPDWLGFTVTKNITITVNAASQTISFANPGTITLPASAFTLNATASSGLTVAFGSTTPGVCSVKGSTLTPIAAGTCSVTATQPGDAVYAAANPVTISFAINTASSGGGDPLTVSPAGVTINATSKGAVGTQVVTLSYQTFTQGAPSFASNFSTNQGTGWLSVSPASGTMTLGSFENQLYTYTATITISGNPAILLAGTYTGTVNFNSANGIASEAVTMVVTDLPAPQPTGGIANAASAGQAMPSVVSPGSYVAIYGSALAGAGNPSATSLPLPTTLNGASVTLCGIPSPLLYASAIQINVLLPQNVASGTCALVVTSGGVQSAPVQLTVQQLQPGIYTVDLSGSGAGVVANALTGQLNSASSPAHAGNFLVIYCTGLGAVQGPNGEAGPSDGAAAPLTTLFSTQAKITATIGGVAAPVSFAGMTPTFAGLYQVNVQVPAGVVPGSAIPVTITAGDVISNVVTIVVQ